MSLKGLNLLQVDLELTYMFIYFCWKKNGIAIILIFRTCTFTVPCYVSFSCFYWKIKNERNKIQKFLRGAIYHDTSKYLSIFGNCYWRHYFLLLVCDGLYHDWSCWFWYISGIRVLFCRTLFCYIQRKFQNHHGPCELGIISISNFLRRMDWKNCWRSFMVIVHARVGRTSIQLTQ